MCDIMVVFRCLEMACVFWEGHRIWVLSVFFLVGENFIENVFIIFCYQVSCDLGSVFLHFFQ